MSVSTPQSEVDPAGDDLMTYLMMLLGGAPEGTFVELRRRLWSGMACELFPSGRLDRVAEVVKASGALADVYVGVRPRVWQRGTAADVPLLSAAWSDCDSADSIARLEHFRPPPSMMVSSGSGRHAYWMLREIASAKEVVAVNRRLAAALDADITPTDAARILRPPDTFNFKQAEPRPVVLERVSPDAVELATLKQALPNTPPRPRRTRAALPSPFGDVLRTIRAELYVEALTGERSGATARSAARFMWTSSSAHPFGTPASSRR